MGRLCGLGLHDRLATGAGQTQAGDLVYDVVAGLLEDDSLDHFLTCLTLFQLFHYIRSQHFEADAAIGAGVTGCDRLRDALEVFGEWLARTRRAGLICGLSIRRRFLFTWSLSGLLNLKLFKDQFQRQLRAAFGL